MIKVMLVDDEPWILKDLRHLIDWEKCGFTVVGEARDYREAEIRIDLLKPDIIICDICMPGDSGLELMKRMKRKYPNRHIVIFISAFTDFAYAREAIRLGALDYIKKPVDRTNLLDALTAAADQLKNNESAAQQSKAQEGESSGQPVKMPQNAVIRNIVLEIEGRYGQKLLISDFAAQYRMNSSYLSQLFKQEVGVSFTDYLVNYRLNQAERLLRDERFSIEEISDKVGYEDHIHFNKMFKKYKQQTPAAYRKQQRHS